MNSVINKINNNIINYKDIFDRNNIVPSNLMCDIAVCIGVRGRQEYLCQVIKYIEAAAEKTSLNICIFVVEHDITENIKTHVKKFFINQLTTNTKELYSRSLCANIGFLCGGINSKWFMYHDSDLLMDENFFLNMEPYLNGNPLWLQPYTEQRVINLSQTTTDIILNDQQIDFTDSCNWASTQNKKGAPGGSIVVRNDVFKRVGGFDPEIFYGYAPEDSMFWVKLECLVKPIEKIDCCHQGGAVYVTDPDMKLYHLWHTHQLQQNPDHNIMHDTLIDFWNYDYAEKMNIINLKRDLFNVNY